MARTGMYMQRGGVGRKQKVLNQLKWEVAASYDTQERIMRAGWVGREK